MLELLADDPIDEVDADQLDCDRFAERVVLLLGRVRAQTDSGVLSLIGPWGAGKSSILRLIKRRLPAADWTVGHFTAWTYNSYGAAVEGFFAELQAALPTDAHWKSRRESLGKLSKRLAPLGAWAESWVSMAVQLSARSTTRY
jgi:predicted KAP-like P-loop ATPase